MEGWDLSCRDWESRIAAGRSIIPDLPLFEEPARRAVEIFNRLRLPDVVGMPLLRDACGDWARDIIRVLFGSYDKTANRRYVEEIFALVGKKNSKTTYLGAAGMLTALLSNERPRAEFLLVGPTQALSELAFSQAVGMVEGDARLRELCIVREHLKEIVYRPTKARLKVKTFSPDILTGPKPVGVFLDELHLLGRNPHASRIILQIRGGREANPEGFFVIASTQSDDPPQGAFREELLTARKIRDGELAGAVMLPVLYEFPRAIAASDDEWKDPRHWHMVVPNNGRSISIDRLHQAFMRAEAGGEAKLRLWASQHLNLEIGQALRSDRWAGADYWARQANKSLTLAAIMARSELIVAGIDGGGLDDLFALAVLGRDAESKEWLLWSKAWAHEQVLERRKQIAPKLRDLAGLNELMIVERLGDDVADCVEILAEIDAAGLLVQIGVDRFGIGAVVDALAERGIGGAADSHKDRVVGINQGVQLQTAIKAAERRLAEAKLMHGGQELMAWAVGNAKVEPKGNAILITKQASGTAKIDPVMAMLNAVSLMAQNPSPPAPEPTSPYDQDETFTVGVI